MERIRERLSVSAPSGRVWSALTSVSGWDGWWTGFQLRDVIPAWQRGASLVWANGTASRIDEFDEERRLAWSGGSAGIDVRWSFRLAKDGIRTLVTHSFATDASFPSLEARIEAELEMRSTLEALKRWAETTTPG